MPRLLYNVPINTNQDYLRDQTRVEFLVPSIAQATIVSSDLGNGLHNPCFDVDIPAVITESDDARVLWIDTKTRRHSYLRLLQALKTEGWVDPSFNPSRADLRKKKRLEDYSSQAKNAQDYSMIWDSCARLADFFEEGIENLIAVGRGVSSVYTLKVPVSMRSPWMFPLVDGIDIFLAPSSTPGHNHLYVEKNIEWARYQALLERFVETGIVEPGYLGASVARNGTNLRRPGYFKGQPDKVVAA